MTVKQPITTKKYRFLQPFKRIKQIKGHSGVVKDQSKAIKRDSTIANYYYARALYYYTISANNILINTYFKEENNKANYQHSCLDFSRAQELGLDGREDLVLEVYK